MGTARAGVPLELTIGRIRCSHSLTVEIGHEPVIVVQQEGQGPYGVQHSLVGNVERNANKDRCIAGITPHSIHNIDTDRSTVITGDVIADSPGSLLPGLAVGPLLVAGQGPFSAHLSVSGNGDAHF